MAKKHRKHRRRHHRGVGTTITLRGLGAAGRRMKGKGAAMMFGLPVLVGVGVTAGALVAARYFTMPGGGSSATAFTPTTQSVYKNAPWIGLAAGLVSALGTYYLMGTGPAVATGVASLGAALTGFASDKILAGDANALAQAATGLSPAAASTSGLGSMFTMRPGHGVRGLGVGAVVPQLDGVVMEPSGMHGLGYTAYSGGEEVTLGGVNPTAFGTPGFSP